MAADHQIPVLAVVGPTASGKTALAVKLAKALGGEVIGADSMQVYQGMEIATAAPTMAEREGVHHHLIGILQPEERFSVAAYVARAQACIAEIRARGSLPILAGGTGLYIETAKQLHPANLGRVIRALELYETTGVTMSEQRERSRRGPSPYAPFYLGLDFRDRQRLYDRINRRVDQMVSDGLLEEAQRFLERDPDGTGAQAIGYKELKPYFSGEMALEEALENLKRATRRYAKRQLTWFRRNERVHWLCWEDYDTPGALYGEACRLVQESDWGRIR